MTPRTFAKAAALAAVLPVLGGCAQMERDDRAAAAASVPQGQVTGPAVSCVDIRSIRSTDVHGDETIDFVMASGPVYRNVLPGRCYSLGFEKRFSYQTPTGRLCSGDTITVLHADGSSGTTCGLGQFLPIELSPG